MEDSVALDSSKQKEFVKSLKGIKKLLKVRSGLSFSFLKGALIDLFF